jgi:hypothetical protein
MSGRFNSADKENSDSEKKAIYKIIGDLTKKAETAGYDVSFVCEDSSAHVNEFIDHKLVGRCTVYYKKPHTDDSVGKLVGLSKLLKAEGPAISKYESMYVSGTKLEC